MRRAGKHSSLRVDLAENIAAPNVHLIISAYLVLLVIAAQGVLGDEHSWHGDRVHSSGHGHGYHDGHQSAQPSGQTRENMISSYLAHGVAFIYDVGFIIHTTKVVLLKHFCIVHIDTNYDTAGSGENLHNSSCILSNALTVLGKVLILTGERFGRI